MQCNKVQGSIFSRWYTKIIKINEGIEGEVATKGPKQYCINAGGLKSSMGYVGCKNIEEMKTKTRFIKISSSAKQESHVHDAIVKEPPSTNQDKL